MFLILQFYSCNPGNKKTQFDNVKKTDTASLAIYNYSTRGECSREAFIELVLPILRSESAYSFNEFHCVINKYAHMGFLFTRSDSLKILNDPEGKRNPFFLRKIEKKTSDAAWYLEIDLCPGIDLSCGLTEFSLYEIDSILKPIVKDFRSLRYLNIDKQYKKLEQLEFQFYYFYDDKEVYKGSKEFFQRMKSNRLVS